MKRDENIDIEVERRGKKSVVKCLKDVKKREEEDDEEEEEEEEEGGGEEKNKKQIKAPFNYRFTLPRIRSNLFDYAYSASKFFADVSRDEFNIGTTD